MSVITLVSGGLDSTLMALLTKETGHEQYPLYINYGQINYQMELNACQQNFKLHNLPEPTVIQLNGYGSLLSCGLTDLNKRIFEDAFLPCRNLMFLTIGAAYAYQMSAHSVAIGLLNDSYSIFPDQTADFIKDAEALISKSLGYKINVLTPLMSFSKSDVVNIAKKKGIKRTYSCHAGTEKPCGVCVACREYKGLEV